MRAPPVCPSVLVSTRGALADDTAAHPVSNKGSSQKLYTGSMAVTRLDAAHRQLITATWLYVDDATLFKAFDEKYDG